MSIHHANSISPPSMKHTSNCFMISSPHHDENFKYPPYFDTIIAGGIGGSAADFAMHSVDTVKTRLQGQPHHRAPKYHNMFQSYKTILKEEGALRGLYAGVTPAMLDWYREQ
ncbi:unnamed protein product [Absidia cylindrospora]